MKCKLSFSGKLEIIAENTLEAYALKKWSEDHKTGSISDFSIVVDFSKMPKE